MQNFPMADLILTGGNIITINTKLPRAEAVAVKHGRILAVGSSTDVNQFHDSRTEVIDLKGRTVVPGFNDAHNHIANFGLRLQMVSLKYPAIQTIPDIIQALKERAATQQSVTSLYGLLELHFILISYQLLGYIFFGLKNHLNLYQS